MSWMPRRAVATGTWQGTAFLACGVRSLVPGSLFPSSPSGPCPLVQAWSLELVRVYLGLSVARPLFFSCISPTPG